MPRGLSAPKAHWIAARAHLANLMIRALAGELTDADRRAWLEPPRRARHTLGVASMRRMLAMEPTSDRRRLPVAVDVDECNERLRARARARRRVDNRFTRAFDALIAPSASARGDSSKKRAREQRDEACFVAKGMCKMGCDRDSSDVVGCATSTLRNRLQGSNGEMLVSRICGSSRRI